MTATKEAVLITEPPPASSRWGMPCLQQRKTDLRLTSWTRFHASSEVSRTETSSSGLIPALLKRTSMRPISFAAFSYISRTESPSDQSACGDPAALERQPALGVLGQVDADAPRPLRREEASRLRADAARGPGDHAHRP